jgi:hypothetical protein
MIMEELRIDEEEAAQLLRKFASVRAAIESRK